MANERDRYIPDLAQDIIRQALVDVRGYALRAYRDDGKLLKEALEWFSERSERTFGYGWCLEHSGVNPNQVRKVINQYLNQRRHNGKANDRRTITKEIAEDGPQSED